MILAIEAAVGGGSLSLVDNEIEVASWIGENEGLRAEHLVTSIDRLLESSSIRKTDLHTVVVSAGPGSFTGIRIGIASALGLKNALDIPMISISALDAMASVKSHTGIVAVPMGRGAAAAQRFTTGSSDGSPFSIKVEMLFELDAHGGFLIHEQLATAGQGHRPITNFGGNIALALAKMAITSPQSLAPPLFISKNY